MSVHQVDHADQLWQWSVVAPDLHSPVMKVLNSDGSLETEKCLRDTFKLTRRTAFCRLCRAAVGDGGASFGTGKRSR
jgi:hypothetical protein